MNESDKITQLWEVSLWPNNQPPILLGEYYAYDAYTAKEIASIENGIPVDDCFHAALAGKNSPINKWRNNE